MKKLASVLLVGACAMLVAGVALASETKSPANTPQKFGAPIKVKRAVEVGQLAKEPERFAGKKIRIEGTVKDVCQGRGCWVEVEAGGASFLARSLDEKILLPKDCKGYAIVVQGVVKALPRAAKVEADSAAKGEGHACPAPAWVLATQGVELTAPATP